mmetsp:Transcript_26371/g.49757  ORF Transcript_26371/g.49757 Transcript_26371/m.49757 type:complete len:250 (+) Transcript_26371:257-1006(+)
MMRRAVHKLRRHRPVPVQPHPFVSRALLLPILLALVILLLPERVRASPHPRQTRATLLPAPGPQVAVQGCPRRSGRGSGYLPRGPAALHDHGGGRAREREGGGRGHMHVAPTVPRGTRGKLPGRFLLGRLSVVSVARGGIQPCIVQSAPLSRVEQVQLRSGHGFLHAPPSRLRNAVGRGQGTLSRLALQFRFSIVLARFLGCAAAVSHATGIAESLWPKRTVSPQRSGRSPAACAYASCDWREGQLWLG